MDAGIIIEAANRHQMADSEQFTREELQGMGRTMRELCHTT